jgi:hypothetical protein
MYARVENPIYYKGLKVAKNVLPIPQGGARKRFGTLLEATLGQNDYTQIFPMAFEYTNQCIYQLIFYNNAIDIYLEGGLVATVTGTNIDGNDVSLIDQTVLRNQVVITVGFQAPYALVRSASSANTISGFTANTLIVASAVTVGLVLPVQFTGTPPTSNPQLKVGRVYFSRGLSLNTVAIYRTATDAAADINRVTFTALGASTMVPQNTWTFAPIVFSNVPVYDFNDSYDAITFTPGATTGTTTLTASGTWGATGGFTNQFIGGLFAGDGGVARIISISSTTVANILIIDDFAATSAISGMISLLSEPAWSDLRGWPNVCGSYQNRAIFANTESLPNGLWCSVVNEYNNFDDSSTLDDMAIDWYPTSEVDNSIDFITPYRNLVIHTDAGVYSTPQLSTVPITPTTFSLTLQDSTPSTVVQPVTIDNQLMIISGRDVNSLLWEFGQSAYVPNLISAQSEHLITDPISMAGFRDRTTAGGRYLFIINRNGVLAMYQTLLSEDIGGWTWAQTSQPYGQSYFRYVISSVLGRCWFIVERQQAIAQTPIAITAVNTVNNTFTATASNFSLTVPTAVLFNTASQLPTTTPQINTATYYYAIGLDVNTFQIYASQSDAIANVNPIAVEALGISSTVIAYTLTTILNLEELSYAVNTDCAVVQSGVNLTAATGLNLFNAQTMTVKADGRVWDSNPIIGGVENITAMGQSYQVDNIEIGFPIQYMVVPLPIAIPLGSDPHTSNLTIAKHIRFVNIMLVDSIGGKVNNQNISLQYLDNFQFDPPMPRTGIMQVSLMEGWNQFRSPQCIITQSDPFDFNLIGLFYRIEI